MEKEKYNFKRFERPLTGTFDGVSLIGNKKDFLNLGKVFWERLKKELSENQLNKFEIRFDEKKKAIKLVPSSTGFKVLKTKTNKLISCQGLSKFLPKGRYLFEEKRGGFICKFEKNQN